MFFLLALAYIVKAPSGRYSCFKVVTAGLVAQWRAAVEIERGTLWFTVSIHQVNV